MKKLITLLFTLCIGSSLLYSQNLEHGDLLHNLNNQLTEALITDGFSPPETARVYAYANIVAYECLVHYYPTHKSLTNQLTEFNGLPVLNYQDINRDLLLVCVFTEVSKSLVYRKHILDHFKQNYLAQHLDLDSESIRITELAADSITASYLKWVTEDNYHSVKEAARYEPFKGVRFWEPTPPAYLSALEPNWHFLRPFVLESSAEVLVGTSTVFDTTEGSKFRDEATQVYEAVNNLTEEQFQIAKFWDCNPLQTQTMGHLNFVSRQLTPAGHWIGIARIIAREKNLDLMSSAEAYMMISVGMNDGFITAWREKYNSCILRPETYINRYINPDWRPILETPPFPEHPSAHSVISASCAEILTFLFGNNCSFIDDTEVVFGLTTREFSSFKEAANEAAISRLYGGIHYMPAIEAGKTTGTAIGSLVLQRIKTRN